MINYFQIQKLASEYEVTEEIIEKDYLIEIVLFYIAKYKSLQQELVFRGGTALKKVYFPDYRFSEDIDFLIDEREDLKEVEKKIDLILKQISSDYPFNLTKRLERGRGRIQFFVLYDIFPGIRTVKELKVDILKEDSIPAHHQRKILFGFNEFKSEKQSLKTYDLESVVSDKICRILDIDNEPRDIYDLWFLLKSKVDISKVKKELKKRYGYEPYFHNLLNSITLEEYRRNWYIRLEKQVKNLPGFDSVIKELKKLIEESFLI
jgi:predicted nucleotidyltransferase component of viral defense system